VVQLNRLIAETTDLLRRLIGSRIALETVLAPHAGAVRADTSQLQQVLMNLAANARDAMPSGGRLTIRTFPTESTGADTEGAAARQFVTLQVADTGEGMDEPTRERIFEPFFTTKDPGRGTGLGLATVQGIVQKLGGYIEVESSPGKGACFSVHLPAASPEPEAERHLAVLDLGTAERGARGM
jgi:signal transduction histidine kinase